MAISEIVLSFEIIFFHGSHLYEFVLDFVRRQVAKIHQNNKKGCKLGGGGWAGCGRGGEGCY
jgi:hypothetical protein